MLLDPYAQPLRQTEGAALDAAAESVTRSVEFIKSSFS